MFEKPLKEYRTAWPPIGIIPSASWTLASTIMRRVTVEVVAYSVRILINEIYLTRAFPLIFYKFYEDSSNILNKQNLLERTQKAEPTYYLSSSASWSYPSSTIPYYLVNINLRYQLYKMLGSTHLRFNSVFLCFLRFVCSLVFIL